ncbi:polyprenyl synthetase [Spirochaetia bacterium]|nr:polyprenyl synthetase [Spirochaetia bacterium]
MDIQYKRRIEKIEAQLALSLPDSEGYDAAWIQNVFGLDLIGSGFVRQLAAPGRELLKRGGKRWRPLLALLVCETLGGGDTVLPLLPLVEFCHNASLIHDDIEDNSDRRRGKPALHLLYGLDTALNSGCFLYFLPLACIPRWNASVEWKNSLYGTWAEHVSRLHLGQSMDIGWHREFGSLPSLDDYYTMCRFKTGCLARFASVLGVYAASAALDMPPGNPGSGHLVEKFGEAAEKLGVGFQILDDVKNLREGVPGKKRGDDIVEGKKSLPVLLFLHGADEIDGRRQQVSRCFDAARRGGTTVPEVEELIAAMENAGAVEKALLEGKKLINEACETFSASSIITSSLSAFPVNTESRTLLAGIASLIG